MVALWVSLSTKVNMSEKASVGSPICAHHGIGWKLDVIVVHMTIVMYISTRTRPVNKHKKEDASEMVPYLV